MAQAWSGRKNAQSDGWKPPTPGESWAATAWRPVGLLLAVAGFLVAVLTPGPAAAQFTKTPPPETRFRFGPLRFTPVIALQNAGRDSNVFLDPTDPLADTSVVLRGSIEAFVPVRSRLRLYGEGWLDWSYYKAYNTERSTDPGGTGRAELDLGPFTLVGGGGALQSRQLYTIDIDQRILREERFGYGGGEWRVTRLISLSGGMERRTLRYDPSFRTSGTGPLTAAALDRDTTTGQLDIRYRITPLTTLVVTAQAIEDEFALSPPGLRTTRSYRYLGGFEFGEKAFLTGRFLIGLRDLPTVSRGSLPSYRGLATQGELALPLFNRGRLVGILQRDLFVSRTPLSVTEGGMRNAYVLTQLTCALDWDLPLRLIARGTVSFTEAKYLLPLTLGDVVYPRVDHLYSAGGSLLRAFGESIRLGGTVAYYRRVSTIPGRSYDRWVYGVSAEVSP